MQTQSSQYRLNKQINVSNIMSQICRCNAEKVQTVKNYFTVSTRYCKYKCVFNYHNVNV